jgi:hypothetical protein
MRSRPLPVTAEAKIVIDSDERFDRRRTHEQPISARRRVRGHRIAFLQTAISYVDTGAGEGRLPSRQPHLFSTSGATSIPHVEGLGRCTGDGPSRDGRLRCSPRRLLPASWTTHGTSTPGSKRLD